MNERFLLTTTDAALCAVADVIIAAAADTTDPCALRWVLPLAIACASLLISALVWFIGRAQ